MIPDFRCFAGTTNRLLHSAKGSEWEKHKYIKKINGDYYYPNSYEGGRHLDSDQKSDETEKRIATDSDMDDDMINAIANDVIRGLFGNGAERREALGESYDKIQSRVNEIIRSSSGSSEKISSENSKEKEEKGSEPVKKAVSKSGGMDMDTVYSVYKEEERAKLMKKGKTVKGAKKANSR